MSLAHTRRTRLLAVVGLVLASVAAQAQQAPADATGANGLPAAAGSAGAANTPANPAAPDPAISREQVRERLVQAFKREYAFLVEQKAALQQSLTAFRDRSAAEAAQLQGRIESLQGQVAAVREQQRQARDNLKLVQERTRETATAQQVLDGTFSQAEATLESYGVDALSGDGFAGLSDQRQVRAAFAAARALVDKRSSVRVVPGEFFTRTGDKVEGQLIKVGGVAAYGVAEGAAGVLAPAGGGRYKVWGNESDIDAARALVAGKVPEVLPMFLYESLDANAADAAAETIIEHIHSGGSIAWVIVGLGGIALLLVLLRAAFLWRASSRTTALERKVGGLAAEGRLEEALKQCQRYKGSAARVVAAALRNMRRDREHLEDIISESMLAESSRLNRFGTMILVIAAVSPLLGLLGTVTGMITTFDVITQFGTGNPKLLSGGIAVALVTTEVGLIVAIPALFAGNLLSSWAEGIKDNMEKAALRVTNRFYQGSEDQGFGRASYDTGLAPSPA